MEMSVVQSMALVNFRGVARKFQRGGSREGEESREGEVDFERRGVPTPLQTMVMEMISSLEA